MIRTRLQALEAHLADIKTHLVASDHFCSRRLYQALSQFNEHLHNLNIGLFEQTNMLTSIRSRLIEISSQFPSIVALPLALNDSLHNMLQYQRLLFQQGIQQYTFNQVHRIKAKLDQIDNFIQHHTQQAGLLNLKGKKIRPRHRGKGNRRRQRKRQSTPSPVATTLPPHPSTVTNYPWTINFSRIKRPTMTPLPPVNSSTPHPDQENRDHQP